MHGYKWKRYMQLVLTQTQTYSIYLRNCVHSRSVKLLVAPINLFQSLTGRPNDDVRPVGDWMKPHSRNQCKLSVPFLKFIVQDIRSNKMSRQIQRNILLVLLSLAWLIVSSEETSARWNHDDPACIGANAPDVSKDPEAFFEWWGSCISDEPEPPSPPEPPVTCDRFDGHKFTDPSGKCWKIVCINDDEWKLEPCIKQVLPLPHIQSLIIRTDGYIVAVATSTRRTKEQLIRPSQAKLLYLVRAMIHGSKLPSNEIPKIREDFWSKQKSVALKPKPAT